MSLYPSLRQREEPRSACPARPQSGAACRWTGPGRLGRVARPPRVPRAASPPPARSELTLSHIGVWASGEWECSVSTAQGNASKKVEIVVLETSASYCPAERVANNRGDFRCGALCHPGPAPTPVPAPASSSENTPPSPPPRPPGLPIFCKSPAPSPTVLLLFLQRPYLFV